MKKIIFILTVLLFTVKSFSQTVPNTGFTKEYYLQKSKNKKNTGWILLASGVVMTTVGAIGFDNTYDDSSDNSTDTYGIVMVGGVIATLASIPFFISSGSNARKAATLALSNQPILLPRQDSYVLNYQPSLSLKFDF